MGLDNRDYIRYSSHDSGGSWGGAWPPMCKALLWTNIGIFLIQIFATPPDGQVSAVQLWLELDRSTLS